MEAEKPRTSEEKNKSEVLSNVYTWVEDFGHNGHVKAALFLEGFKGEVIEAEIDRKLLAEAGFEGRQAIVHLDVKINENRDRLIEVLKVKYNKPAPNPEPPSEGGLRAWLFL